MFPLKFACSGVEKGLANPPKQGLSARPPIEVSFHDEFMEPGLAPTFNSNPVEFSLHQIDFQDPDQPWFACRRLLQRGKA